MVNKLKKGFALKVKAGIAFLNVIRPHWQKRIDLEELDLSESRVCVLGELGGNYTDERDALGLNDDSAEALGFYINNGKDKKYSLLTSIWKREIRKLL